MKELTNLELNNISGGGFSIGLAAAIAAGVIFALGFLDGWINKKC